MLGANQEGPLPAMVSEETITHAAEESTWYICSHWDGTCAASVTCPRRDACLCINSFKVEANKAMFSSEIQNSKSTTVKLTAHA
jgi:hypothetical protein